MLKVVDNDYLDALEYHCMTNYLLRAIPAKLWQRVKIQAARRGETVRAAILRMLAEYAK